MEAIKQLLAITDQLKVKHSRNFTLDGKLVGDIGEVLAAEVYAIDLLPEATPVYDAVETSTGRRVQIKASFKDSFYFPHESKMPDYFLCILINKDGTITERYNGKGIDVFNNLIKNKIKGDSTGYIISTKKLISLNDTIPEPDKILKRLQP